MTLRASDPCRLLVLSRNAADATEHAQEVLGEGRSRRWGVLQRHSHQHTCGCLDAARDLHWGRGEARSACRRLAKFSYTNFFFLKISHVTLQRRRTKTSHTGHKGHDPSHCANCVLCKQNHFYLTKNFCKVLTNFRPQFKKNANKQQMQPENRRCSFLSHKLTKTQR